MRQCKILTAVFVALSAFPSAAAFPAVAAESIVGAWSANRACKEIDRIDISSMSLGGEDWYCSFNSVSRKGDVVTWRGRCGSPDVEDDPHPYASRSSRAFPVRDFTYRRTAKAGAHISAARNELDSRDGSGPPALGGNG